MGMPSWLRTLVRPDPGRALAYVDWEQQEFGIAAALSGDDVMQAAYASGDPYWDFALRAKAVPPGSHRKDYEDVRNIYKTVVIATQYLMTAITLGRRLGIQTIFAKQLLDQHRQLFAKYWKWSNRVWITAVSHEEHSHSARLVLSYWPLPCARSAASELGPSRQTGAEMMRIACVLATEAE